MKLTIFKIDSIQKSISAMYFLQQTKLYLRQLCQLSFGNRCSGLHQTLWSEPWLLHRQVHGCLAACGVNGIRRIRRKAGNRSVGVDSELPIACLSLTAHRYRRLLLRHKILAGHFLTIIPHCFRTKNIYGS